VRVVILGQDPYPTPGRATGLAFSFPPGQPPRDSLRNILAELAADTGQTRADGDLTGWARQGVLLLNTVLTVPPGQANGHKGWGWEALAAQVLSATAADGPRAFLLWGAPAQRLRPACRAPATSSSKARTPRRFRRTAASSALAPSRPSTPGCRPGASRRSTGRSRLPFGPAAR
jgi:uracil-DNA glycosylase